MCPFFVSDFMYRQNQSLLNLFRPAVKALGFELLGIDLNQNAQRSILRIYIDKDAGITLDDCVLVSRQLTGLLDVEDPIPGHYELEVSSPGLDRPLFTAEQLGKCVGKTIKLRLYEKQAGRRQYIGLLISVEEDLIRIHCDAEDIEVPLHLIDTARLVPQF